MELMNERQKQRKEMNIPDLKERIKKGDRRAKAQIVQEYMAQQEWKKAIREANFYLMEEMENAERYQVLIKQAMCYFYLKEFTFCEIVLNDAIPFNTDKRNAHLVMLGMLHLKLQEYFTAKKELNEAIKIPKPETFWFLYPEFYHEVPKKLLKIVRLKIDHHISRNSNLL